MLLYVFFLLDLFETFSVLCNGYFFTLFVYEIVGWRRWGFSNSLGLGITFLQGWLCWWRSTEMCLPICKISFSLTFKLDSASGCQNVLILKIAEAQNNLGAEYHTSPMVGFVSPQPRVLRVSPYVWNPGTFHWPPTVNAYQADQPCIRHIPGKNAIIWTEKATLTFLISERTLSQRIVFTYLL